MNEETFNRHFVHLQVSDHIVISISFSQSAFLLDDLRRFLDGDGDAICLQFPLMIGRTEAQKVIDKVEKMVLKEFKEPALALMRRE